MIGFEYYNPAKIVFGEDSEKKIKDLLKAYEVKSLLLVYSGDFIKTLGIYSVIEDAVKELGISFTENGNVVPNPSIDLVRDLVKQGKENKTDFVLAVGGGSSIDTAKAVALDAEPTMVPFTQAASAGRWLFFITFRLQKEGALVDHPYLRGKTLITSFRPKRLQISS